MSPTLKLIGRVLRGERGKCRLMCQMLYYNQLHRFVSTRTCMQSTVWFTDLSSRPGKSLIDKTGRILRAAGLSGKVAKGDLTAVKLHFGEKGNAAFVRPVFVRRVVEEIAAAGGKPFLTDTNTLYVGSRCNAADHLRTAVENGFAIAVVGAPLVIADGLRGESAVTVPVQGRMLE